MLDQLVAHLDGLMIGDHGVGGTVQQEHRRILLIIPHLQVGTHISRTLTDLGIEGFWNDMNEPALFYSPERLREFLEGQGCVFVSQTDTEVIAHLLHYLYRGDMVQALREASGMLEGSWALCVLHRGEPDKFWATRKDSPLVLGLGEGENLAASDIPAILGHTREIALLEDKEIAEVRADGVRILTPMGGERPVRTFHVDWDVAAAEKGGWPHFMLKEIHEEPEALQKTFTAHVDAQRMTLRQEAFPMTAQQAQALRKMSIVACGTAYHAGMIGKYLMERLARLPVEAEVASEFRYRNPILGAEDLCMAVSQSGESRPV